MEGAAAPGPMRGLVLLPDLHRERLIQMAFCRALMDSVARQQPVNMCRAYSAAIPAKRAMLVLMVHIPPMPLAPALRARRVAVRSTGLVSLHRAGPPGRSSGRK